jgi:hypothetical protein
VCSSDLALLTPLNDPSNGLTASNFHSVPRSLFTATANNGVTSTNEGFEERGYVECIIATLPTATNNTFSLGLSNAQSGTPLYELRALWDGSAPIVQLYINGVAEGAPVTDINVGTNLKILKYNEGQITFLVDGNAIPFNAVDTNLVLYPIVKIFTSGDTVENFQLVNWSQNLATPEAITLVNDTNITVTPELATPLNYPAIYYMYFAPPADMAVVAAPLNPTGLPGYVLGMRQVDNTTNNLPVLWNAYSFCADDPNNNFIDTGTQTTAKVFTLNTGNYQPDIGGNTFMLVLRNAVNVQTRTVEVPVPDTDNLSVSGLLSSTAGMTGLILVQVEGDDLIPVGIPTSVLLSS